MKLTVVPPLLLLLSLSHDRFAVAASTLEASVRDAYHVVERECSAEVERLCQHHDDLNVVSARTSAMVDPPSPPLAPRRDMEQPQQKQQEQEPSLLEMDELTKIVDGMMESILNTPTFHHSVSFVDEQPDSFVLAPPPPMMIMMFDSMITDLASSQPYHDLPIFADRLVAHGFRILDSEDDNNDSAGGVVRCHLARRLTEVNADTLHHRIHMPFGQCLMNAFERGDISKECHDSMARLANLELEQEEKANRLADILVCVYCGIMIMVLFYRCKNKPNKMVRSCRFRVRLFVLLILACVAIVNPFLLFPVLWAIVLCKIIYRYYAKNEDDDMPCGCCCSCCGATPEAAKNGTLTEDQLACCCCNGTGECSCCCCCSSSTPPKELACCCCCSCCGATPEAAKNGTLTEDQLSCCCCNGTGECSCCCCCCCCCSKKSSPKGRGQKHVLNSSTAVYEGVPIQIV